MLDPKLIRNNIQSLALNLKKRGFQLDIEKINALEEDRKSLQSHIQTLQNQRNLHSKTVGKLKQSGEDISENLKSLKELSDLIKVKEASFNQIQENLEAYLSTLPNLLHESVPEGLSEKDNKVVRTWGEPSSFSFTPKDHTELGPDPAWLDTETSAKLSGSRYVVLRGPMARLQRALIQFMLDLHTKEHGYQEIYVPYIVNEECFFGTGQLPKFKEDLFAIKGEAKQYLISTAETPVTNTVREQILQASQLPIKYVCYSSCFRSEAGSYGKDMGGIFRLHQFEKVELVQIVRPSESYQVLESLTQDAEKVLQRLELPYRVVTLCSADIGFAAAKTYDLEVWLPGQNKYREISSCSNFEAFQARRMKARFKNESGQIELVHTLNGSGLAVGRTMIAILENYQDQLGRIHIPKSLQPYMDDMKVIE